MVADDDERNLFSLKEVLLDCGAEVDLFRDGEELLLGLEKQKSPHFIVLDMMMPKLNGLEVIKKLRSNPKWKQLPVIILTASVDQGLKQEALREGANAYLHKPVRLREFEAAVAKIIQS